MVSQFNKEKEIELRKARLVGILLFAVGLIFLFLIYWMVFKILPQIEDLFVTQRQILIQQCNVMNEKAGATVCVV